MSMRRTFLASLMAWAIAGATGSADAAFSYTTSLVINSINGAGGLLINNPGVGATFNSNSGSVITLGNYNVARAFQYGGSLAATLGTVSVRTTSTTADSFSVNYSIFVTITDPYPGSSNFTVSTNGTLTLSGLSNAGGTPVGTVSNQFSGPFLLGPGTFPNGDTFSVSIPSGVNAMFTPPTVNGGSSNFNGTIISGSAVPEPASLAMVLIGLGGVGVVARRRRPAQPTA